MESNAFGEEIQRYKAEPKVLFFLISPGCFTPLRLFEEIIYSIAFTRLIQSQSHSEYQVLTQKELIIRDKNQS